MRRQIITPLTCLIFLFGISSSANAQRVVPLVPGITVDSIYKVKPGATKLAMDPVSGRLFYSVLGGEIYEVFIQSPGTTTDTLRYNASHHGIPYLQGLCFRDSVMYVCGNWWSSTTGIGKIAKGTLQPNGTRVWTNILNTNSYETANINGDHGFSAVNIDPAGNYIYVSSGARTHLGEIRTNGGTWPNKREVPMTSRIFRFPINSVGLTLSNDSNLIDNSGYLFATGTRNAYDMGWDGNNNLFAIDNSGERDDPEELNWLQQGKNYGYPWRMGDNRNPISVSPYNVNNDPLVNHLSSGYLSGWFADDPTFPAIPSGVAFTDPVRNYGTTADFFRDSISGNVKNASDEGTYISTFTAHRSPLGLVFDRDSMLAAPFRGDGFVMSFMPGGDSTGYSPISPWGGPVPFVDTSRELVQMKLVYNAGIDNYTMTTSNIVGGFYLPVDAELVSNVMYVIENGGALWKLNFPLYVGQHEIINTALLIVYPNPFTKTTTLQFNNPNSANHSIIIYDMLGKVIRTINNVNSERVEIDRASLVNGAYFVELRNDFKTVATRKLIIE